MSERLPHPGSWAAAATLVLGVAAWPVLWTRYGRGHTVALLLDLALVLLVGVGVGLTMKRVSR